tara:strand:- start:1245 stop:1487 length:243 start_codon:yes stop_codon:yes gene_type:complete
MKTSVKEKLSNIMDFQIDDEIRVMRISEELDNEANEDLERKKSNLNEIEKQLFYLNKQKEELKVLSSKLGVKENFDMFRD